MVYLFTLQDTLHLAPVHPTYTCPLYICVPFGFSSLQTPILFPRELFLKQLGTQALKGEKE